jgi:hypothetical protein
MKKYFFEQTNTLHDEIVALHDFVLPTSTALFHFRSVIEKELADDPSVAIAKLSAKYNVAPGTRGSTNLKTAFSSHTWEEQRIRLAEVALVGVIALYEIWCDQICDVFARPDLAVKMQWPTNKTATSGVRFAIAELTVSPSPIIASSIYPGLVTAKKYSFSHLDSLLKCFRYFKELRNCLMHRGRSCEGKLFGAQSDFIPIATKKGLGMDFVPVHGVYKMGDPVSLDLHGVLGFTDVILRIITTIDAEMSKTAAGEQILLQRISSENKTPMLEKKLPLALETTMGWKSITVSPALTRFLRNSHILR